MIRNTGIGTYIQGLLEGFRKTGLCQNYEMRLFGKEGPENFPSAKRVSFRSKIYSFSEQIEYPFRLNRCSVWHSPHYNIPMRKGKTKLVVTVHDLIHWIFRREFFTSLQAFYAGKMLRHVARQADHIITVSQKTKDDLIYHFDADPAKISVIHEGVAEVFRTATNRDKIEAARKKYGVPESFFLYVGMMRPHKNVLWLIHLFRRLRKESKIDAGLVLIGKKDRRYPEEFEALSKLQPQEGIFHIPYVETEELAALYTQAIALVHPSLYEGFGLTLLEAMACGTAVIACRAASIPEVVGEEAACLVDPCADGEMANALIRLEKVTGLREELERRGRVRAQRFSWDQAAAKTAEVYEKVLSE